MSSWANVIIWDEILSSWMKCYHLELMLSSGANVIIWDKMLSSGANVIIWDKMLSSGAKVIMWSSGANVIIWFYHVMLSSNTPLFYFPENFTHSIKIHFCQFAINKSITFNRFFILILRTDSFIWNIKVPAIVFS